MSPKNVLSGICAAIFCLHTQAVAQVLEVDGTPPGVTTIESRTTDPDQVSKAPQACKVDLPGWATDSERLVWGEICNEGSADISKWTDGTCFTDSPYIPALEPWSLSNDFMTLILTDPAYVAARPTTQVSLYCAFIPELDLSERRIGGSLRIKNSVFEEINLSDMRIDGMLDFDRSLVLGDLRAYRVRVDGPLSLYHAHIEGEANFIDATIAGWAQLGGVNIAGLLDLERVVIQKSLFLRNGGQFSNVTLLGAEIAGNLNASGSTFEGHFGAQDLKTGGNVFLSDSATFNEVDLLGADIGGNLNTDGSTFIGRFNADSLRTGGNLYLRYGATFNEVDLLGADIGGNLNTDGSTFIGRFNADSLRTGGSLYLRYGATFDEVHLLGADIGGAFEAIDATFKGELNASQIRTKRSIFLRGGSNFETVILRGAHIGGTLEMDGSTFNKSFNANGVTVDDDLFLRADATFNKVDLRGARIGGILDLGGSTFKDLLDAGGIKVEEGAFLGGDASFSEVRLVNAHVNGIVQLQGSTFGNEVNLSEAQFGSLLLWRGTRPQYGKWAGDVTWEDGASLVLRNTKVGSLQARMEAKGKGADSWYKISGARLPVDLNGFTYQRLGGFSSNIVNDLSRIDANALIEWVSNSVPPGMEANDGYRPQPYRALETALKGMGAEAAARQVAFARLEHRADTRITADLRTDFQGWLRQSAAQVFDRFLQFTVGFGVYPARAFYWFFGLVLVGAVIARKAGQFCEAGPMDCFWYSLENAIPLIEPSEDHKITHPEAWVRSFFHFQKVSGFILASVIIGALTLTG